VKCKLVLNTSLFQYLYSRSIKDKLKKMEDQLKVHITLNDRPRIRCLKRDEGLCTVSGKLADVQSAVVIFLRLIEDQYYVDK